MTNSSDPRVFFAACPVDTERTALLDLIKDFEPNERLRWLTADNWHVTLRFVGNTPAGIVPRLSALVAQLARDHMQFTLNLNRIEPFPAARHPLVVAATADPVAAGVALVSDLEVKCQHLQLKPETRPWRPHMTLARVRGRRPLPEPDVPISLDLNIRELALMESVPGERGRVYVPIATAPLGA